MEMICSLGQRTEGHFTLLSYSVHHASLYSQQELEVEFDKKKKKQEKAFSILSGTLEKNHIRKKQHYIWNIFKNLMHKKW